MTRFSTMSTRRDERRLVASQPLVPAASDAPGAPHGDDLAAPAVETDGLSSPDAATIPLLSLIRSRPRHRRNMPSPILTR